MEKNLEILVNSKPILAETLDSNIDIVPLYKLNAAESKVVPEMHSKIPKTIPAKSTEKLPEKIHISTTHISEEKKSDLSDKKHRIINILKKPEPKRILKTKDIWAMSMSESRRYLQ